MSELVRRAHAVLAIGTLRMQHNFLCHAGQPCSLPYHVCDAPFYRPRLDALNIAKHQRQEHPGLKEKEYLEMASLSDALAAVCDPRELDADEEREKALIEKVTENVRASLEQQFRTKLVEIRTRKDVQIFVPLDGALDDRFASDVALKKLLRDLAANAVQGIQDFLKF